MFFGRHITFQYKCVDQDRHDARVKRLSHHLGKAVTLPFLVQLDFKFVPTSLGSWKKQRQEQRNHCLDWRAFVRVTGLSRSPHQCPSLKYTDSFYSCCPMAAPREELEYFQTRNFQGLPCKGDGKLFPPTDTEKLADKTDGFYLPNIPCTNWVNSEPSDPLRWLEGIISLCKFLVKALQLNFVCEIKIHLCLILRVCHTS